MFIVEFLGRNFEVILVVRKVKMNVKVSDEIICIGIRIFEIKSR